MKQMTKREFIQKHAELKKKFKEAKRALKHVYSLTKGMTHLKSALKRSCLALRSSTALRRASNDV